MPPNFTFYRILCCNPPDLDPEREAFESAVTQFVEQVTMPDRVLFAPASLRPPIHATVQKSAIEANIRMCEFFVQIFGEQWPDPVFAGFVEYAQQCAADPSMATRSLAVLFRSYASAAPELRRFRERLEAGGQCEIRDFSGTEELARLIRELLSAWYAPLKPPQV